MPELNVTFEVLVVHADGGAMAVVEFSDEDGDVYQTDWPTSLLPEDVRIGDRFECVMRRQAEEG